MKKCNCEADCKCEKEEVNKTEKEVNKTEEEVNKTEEEVNKTEEEVKVKECKGKEKKNETKELLEEAGYGKLSDDDLKTASNLSKKYIDDLGRVKELYEETKKVINEDDKYLKYLKETSTELYDRLDNMASLEVAKQLNESSRIVNNTDFNNYVDIVHNRLNKARQEAIKQATDKIIDIYTDAENDKDVVSSIIAAYIDGRQSTAKKIAENKLTNGAAELIDCLDILH